MDHHAPESDLRTLDPATWDTIDRWLTYRTWHSQVPGAQVAVGVGGEVLFSRAYGYADLERRIPMRPDHLFRIASHSKTFTATLVLQLVDEGLLGLEDAIGTHLPELTGELGAIRVRELLEHTAGVLRDGLDGDFWQFARAFPDRHELLAMVNDGGAKTGPGELFAYSNLGYSLLGLLVETVTGSTYAEAARERIVRRLGLPDTAADYLVERAADYAVGYSGMQTALQHGPLQHVDTVAMDAATGFTSTASDLVAFFGAHRFGDERLLSDRTKRLQQRQANAADPKKTDDGGYGWGMIVEKVDEQVFVGHAGGYPGHITKTLLDPSSGVVVSVATNAMDGPATEMARGIVQLLAKATANAKLVSTQGATPVSPAALALTGRYAGAWGVADIASVGGRLMAVGTTGWAPVDGADELEDAGDGRLRIAAGNGFGSVNEYVTFELVYGSVSTMRYGAMSMRPFPDLPER